MAIGTLTSPQVAHRRKRLNEFAKSLIGDILAFLIGLGACYSLKLVGALPLSEVVLLLSLPLLLLVHFDRLRLRKRRLGVVLTLMLLWLFGQIVTDIYRSTPMLDWIRGQLNICVFILDLIGLIILIKGNDRRKLILLFSLAVGLVLSVRLRPELAAGGEAGALKFGYSTAILYFIAVICCYFYKRDNYAFMGLFLLADIGFNIIFNLRNPTLTAFISTCLLLPIIPERIGRVRILPPVRTHARIFVVLGITLISGAAIGKIMTSLAASGALGPEAQQKNQLQTTAGWGVLIGGRPEILVSSRAVIDSPILGHGSWAKDMKYTAMLSDIENEYGMKVTGTLGEKNDFLIPAHSHLMNGWVFSGILGAVFWIYIFISNTKALFVAVQSQLPLKPAYVLLFVSFAWDILFSPFGGDRRLTVGYLIVLICDVLDPDSPGRQMTAQALAHTKGTFHQRNLGRLNPRFKRGF